ncbi:hypothetical protein [Natrinema hispanicum]|uniref:DHHA1 domain-containing protein n=1 Tax=Natrinema hispanicum TaxID=392421 RepID=A0A1I0IVL1_9EURY|nr:hypothetical protein [Natrinema hispanicum]SEU01302.1 DHHA1 domain-containing protein [Natrinema hispanicum]
MISDGFLARDQLGGGGHPTAAGCEVPVETFRDLADYWKTAEASVREDLLEAVLAVIDNDGDDNGDNTPDVE